MTTNNLAVEAENAARAYVTTIEEISVHFAEECPCQSGDEPTPACPYGAKP